jgi:hypothetical protein
MAAISAAGLALVVLGAQSPREAAGGRSSDSPEIELIRGRLKAYYQRIAKKRNLAESRTTYRLVEAFPSIRLEA